ncbi:MAG: Fic family protein [Candidatus Gracilibacteria bacterium]|nr:Fic family protein [Candidatus Gracilibacteria bacterium]
MYQETIKQTLLPRFNHLSLGKSDEIIDNMRNGFEAHIRLMSDYFKSYNNFPDKLDMDLFVGFHKLLYPTGFEIKAIGNDGISHIMYPGEWRKQYFVKQITNFTKVEEIEKDFQKIIDNFNSLENKTREDILRFYLDFGKVHPFGDSNGTVSAIICDILCVYYNFKPLELLKIRFNKKNNLFSLISEYEKDDSNENLSKILVLIDKFNGTI